ncbi:TetR/AcrR family transcriptional regulator [Novosphingopyxis sp.]|uniref:TetR/AcrR family transcriptional regulator n=1 Tax=Novosphingopyxis sp. TaxID=2709690 RepID=UPI003B5C4618
MSKTHNSTRITNARERILSAALALLTEGGRDALTTRAVAEAADVQAPIIYRLFGDKAGLLDAAAEYGLALYVADKSAHTLATDPLTDLRESWDRHIAFGLANPALFAITSGELRQGPSSPAAAAGMETLRSRVSRIARSGLLKVSQERAVSLLHAIGTGAILTLLNTPEDERDLDLAIAAREAAIAAITNGEAATEKSAATSATTLKAQPLDETVLQRI